MTRRLSTFVIALGGAILLGGWLFGGEGELPVAFAAFAASVAMIVFGLLLRRVAARSEHRMKERWLEPTTGEVAPVPSSTAKGSGGGGAVWALGGVEARELTSSPWFAVGVALSLLELVLFGVVWTEDFTGHWWNVASALTLFVHPFVGMLVIAGHRAVTRSRRDGCDELFSTCPLDEGGRLTGQLLPALVVAPIVAAFASAVFVAASNRQDVYGAGDGRVWVIVATCGVLGAGGLALGVAVGRWVPFFLAPVLALIAIIFLDSRILELGGVRWATDRYLATFDPGDGPDQLLLDLPVVEQLLWFLGLTVVVVALALVGRRRWALPALVAGAALALVAAVGVTAPMSGMAERAALLSDPPADQWCLEVNEASNSVEVCGPHDYRGATSRYSAGVAPVVVALPAGSGPMRLRMRLVDGADELPVELSDALPNGFRGDGRFRARDGEPLAFPAVTHASAIRAARFRLVAAPLGLPTEADSEDERPTVVAGRADGLVVLWMGTIGMESRALAALTVNPDDHADEVFDATAEGRAWPDPRRDGPAPLSWAPEDLEAAKRLAEVPDDRVLRVVHERWEQLDTMTTDELLEAVGVDPVGPTSDVEARPHVCPY